jgi:hypothetical protein
MANCLNSIGQISLGDSSSVACCSPCPSTVPDVGRNKRPVGLTKLRDRSSRWRSPRTTGPGALKRHGPLPTVLFISGDAKSRRMLSRIAQHLENMHLVMTDSVREGRLLAVSLRPRLILLDAQLSAVDANELLVYLGRSSFTSTMPLAVLPGSEDERMDLFLRTPDHVEMATPSS